MVQSAPGGPGMLTVRPTVLSVKDALARGASLDQARVHRAGPLPERERRRLPSRSPSSSGILKAVRDALIPHQGRGILTANSGGRAWRAVPLVLALAMLAVVVFAGLLPDTGVVSASSNCTYGKCPAAQPFPLWAVGASIAVVVIALILALLLLRRSRRRPPTGGGEPPDGSAPTSPSEESTSPEEYGAGSPAPEEGEPTPPAQDEAPDLYPPS